MKIGFTEEEKFKIRMFIDRYHHINMEVESLKERAGEIQKRISEEGMKLKEIKKEEDAFMDELHKKYGDFTIQDVGDSLL